MRAVPVVALAAALASCGGGTTEPAATSFCAPYEAVLRATRSMDEAPNAEGLREAAGAQRDAIGALAAEAPRELTQAVDDLTDRWERVLAILDRYDYDALRLVNEATAEERAVLLELDAAGGPADDPTRIVQDWVREHCPGVSVPPPPTFSPTGESLGM